MSDFEPLVGWGVVIAASVVAGAVLAAALRLPARVAALVSSFAGGVLLAAVAFELVPDSEEHAGLWLTALGLIAGARRQRRGDRRGRAARGDLDLDRAYAFAEVSSLVATATVLGFVGGYLLS